MFSFIGARINGWVNISKAGDLRRYRTRYDIIVMEETEFLLIRGVSTLCLVY